MDPTTGPKNNISSIGNNAFAKLTEPAPKQDEF